MKKLSVILKKLDYDKVVLLLVLFFFVLNAVWVKFDRQLPFTGDDARFLQGTYELYAPLKDGNLAEAWKTWQSMFIHPDRFPRTPLFALLSVPTFLLLGVSEDSAIITNLFVFAANSLLLYYLVRLLLPKSKNAKAIGLTAVLLYNVVPGGYGYARLYLSETLQTTFVLTLAYFFIRNQGKRSSDKYFFVLGFVAALSFLLRFIIPIYLLVPALYFGVSQLKLKLRWSYYARALLMFMLAFVPVSLTWYARNFVIYYQFAKYTSFGELTKYYSLGPSYDARTILRFWYVIATWIFGWPLTVMTLVLAGIVGLERTKQLTETLKKLRANFKKGLTRILSSDNVYLFLSPIPALISATASEGKTSRYFAPVIFFWLILLARAVISVNMRKKLGVALVSLLLAFCFYPYLQSLIPYLPKIPRTNLNPAAGIWNNTGEEGERYDLFLGFVSDFTKDKTVTARIYNTAEQPRFNDAELIWYATQKGYHLINTDEFSRYSNLEEAYAEVDNAEILIVESSPEAGGLWAGKYTLLTEYALNHPDFFVVTEQEFADGSVMKILVKNLTYGSN